MSSSTGDKLANYDHSHIAHLPEYAAAAHALDALAHALTPSEHDAIRQDWLDLVTNMAAGLVYSDACEADRTHLATPCATEVTDGWVNCTYHCPQHQRTWRCGYAEGFYKWV